MKGESVRKGLYRRLSYMTRTLFILPLLILLLFQDASFSCAAISLPRTGQTSCWDAAGAAVSCLGKGQDGESQAGAAWPAPRFVDNGDQTMSDKLTGLVWSKDANPAKAVKTWQQALTYLKTLNSQSQGYLGHNDWRLPNVAELRSLASAQQTSLATWLDSQGFANAQADSYWSSDSDALYPAHAWCVVMDSGYLDSHAKTGSGYLWPVRGKSETSAAAPLAKTGQTLCWDAAGAIVSCAGTGQDGESQTGVAWPAARFTDNGDRTVTDALTGLIWSGDANAMPARDPSFDRDYLPANAWESANDGEVSWQHALDYLTKLNNERYLGYNDWRLPNREELASMIDWQAGYPAIWLDLYGFTNVAADYYWSSSSDPLYTDAAWFVDMGSGYIDSYYKSDNHYVWPVRSKAGQSVDFAPPAAAVYGDGAIPLTASASSNLPVSFTLVSGPAVLANNLLTITGVGTVTVKASQPGSAGYFPAPDVTKTIAVAARQLTVAAGNAGRAYGDANPANPGFTASGLVGSDAVGSVIYSYAASATATAAVGSTHGIAVSNAVFASGSASNYSIIYLPGTLTILAPASYAVAGSVSGGAGVGGQIECSTPVIVGRTTTCTLTPDAGYRLVGASGCGAGQLSGAVYTTAAVTGDCTVLAQFAVIAPGDCDADGAVTAFELQNSIDMFLGLKPVQRCVDLDNSGGVDAGELQKVVVGFPGQ